MKKYKLLTYLGMLLLIALYIFVEAPNLNPFFYADGAFFWAVVITAFIGVWALFRFGELTIQFIPGSKGRAERPFNYVPNEKFPKWIKLLLVLPWAFLIIMMIASSFIFNWKTYRDQLGESRVMQFSSDMQAVDLAQVPIVDKTLALNLADKKLGERAGLGSQVVIGRYDATIQRLMENWSGRYRSIIPVFSNG